MLTANVDFDLPHNPVFLVGAFSIHKAFLTPNADVLSFVLSKCWAHGLWTDNINMKSCWLRVGPHPMTGILIRGKCRQRIAQMMEAESDAAIGPGPASIIAPSRKW